MGHRFLALALTLLVAQSASAWNGTGHQIVAGIAWDNMTETARRNAIELLQQAPDDACLLDLFPNDARPLAEREREFFMRVATWADIVRPFNKPNQPDTRACTRFHRGGWHFINFFWSGLSGASGANAPHDRTDIPVPELNAVERLDLFRPIAVCSAAACGTTPAERATTLAWIIHLTGDIHQPLHTSARATTHAGEEKGDQGGNLFKLGTDPEKSPSLHSFWDGIVDRSIQRTEEEKTKNIVYLDRVIGVITQDHPRSSVSESDIHSFDPDEWAHEGLVTAKKSIYPATLKREKLPSEGYRKMAFDTSDAALALAGYRLADLLNRMFPEAP
jgi:hypothetical protein